MNTMVYDMIEGRFIDEACNQVRQGQGFDDLDGCLQLALQPVDAGDNPVDRLIPMPPELARISVSQFLSRQG